MVGYIIGFIICAVAFLGLLALAAIDTDIDDTSAAVGVGLVLSFLLTIVFAAFAFAKEETYHEKYHSKLINVKECRIDTTFTTVNGVTDTTYTFYYNGVKEKD